MKYYVIIEGNNRNTFKKYNVFQHYWVEKDVEEFRKLYLKHQLSRNELIEKLDSLFKYCFWSKCEYEVILSPWPPIENVAEKIDVYYQLKDNIPVIADMLINEWEKK